MAPQTGGASGRSAAARRMQILIWLAMVASVGMYFVLVQLVTPAHAQENPALVNILLVSALTLVGASFPLKKRIRSQATPGGDPDKAQQSGLLVALALCEAAALCGVVVWFNTAWPYYYVFMLLGLGGQLAHYPGLDDQE
ncbi:MAG TPA: hypothetical protein VGH38_02980 [Bryobacteraceae bacterium]